MHPMAPCNMPRSAPSNSADSTRSRFDTLAKSISYAQGLDGTRSHRREEKCLDACLDSLPAGSLILDLPCGTGRLLPHLHSRGFTICAADSSRHMLDRARELATRNQFEAKIDFRVEDLLATSFADRSVDAVICNRLFHHFTEPDTRIRAFKELARVSRGPIVVSFFCSRSLSSQLFLFRNRWRRTPHTDRLPIPLATIAAEANLAGLHVRQSMASKPIFGKQWYLVLSPLAKAPESSPL
jgi:SAM-dependent methyltransferase